MSLEPEPFPLDPQLQVVMNLDPATLATYCRTSPEVNMICQADYFIKPYLAQYGITPLELPGDTSRAKLGFLSIFDWEKVPGTTLPKKGQYISRSIQLASSFDPKDAIRDARAYIEPRFDEALVRAVKTSSPQFVQYIMNILISKVGVNNMRLYRDSLRKAFINTIAGMIRYPDRSQEWLQINQMIGNYYNAQTDSHLRKRFYQSAIIRGDMAIIHAMSLIFPPKEDNFWTAVYSAQPQVATYFLNHLVAQGIDPRLNHGAAYEEYKLAIISNDMPLIQTLVQFVIPDETLINMAEDEGRPEIATFMQSELNKYMALRA